MLGASLSDKSQHVAPDQSPVIYKNPAACPAHAFQTHLYPHYVADADQSALCGAAGEGV